MMFRTTIAAWCIFAATVVDKIQPTATLNGHVGTVIAVAFSPDGTRLASASDDGTLKIWDIAAQKVIGSVEGVSNNQNEVRFSPDGKTVFVRAAGPNVIVVDTATGKAKEPIAVSDLPGGAMAFDLSPDGKSIALVGRSTLRIYDVATAKMTYAYEVHKQYAVPSVAWSPDGKSVVTVGTDRKALVVEIATGRITSTFDLKQKGVLASFSRDGKQTYVYTDDRVITAFDLTTGESKKLLDGGVPVFTMAVSPDGKTIAAAGTSRGGPGLLSIDDGRVDDPFECNDRIKSAAASPDGHWVAAGGNEGAIYLLKMPK